MVILLYNARLYFQSTTGQKMGLTYISFYPPTITGTIDSSERHMGGFCAKSSSSTANLSRQSTGDN